MPTEGMSPLKTGQRPIQLNIRSLKPGDVLCEEGTQGRELYIIEDGKLSVYKSTQEGATIELATVGKGNIIGEMSLLDNLPRSASVKAIDPTKVLVINQQVFLQTLLTTPPWLNSIITIIVSRLRDANKRVDASILRDRERGLVCLMLLLLPSYRHEYASTAALDYNLVCVEAFFVCRLRRKEISRLLDQLRDRALISVEEDAAHVKHVCIRDVEVLKLFEEYLILKSQQKTFRESSIPDDSVAMLSNIAYVAQKSGTETDEGIVLSKAALLEDLQDKDAGHLEKNLLDLRRRGLINLMPTDNDTQIIFRKEALSRIKKIREWLPKFEAAPDQKEAA
jgi:CRP-like cAMP-binding protein